MARQGLFASAQEVEGVLGPGGFPAGLGSSRTKQCRQVAYGALLEGETRAWSARNCWATTSGWLARWSALGSVALMAVLPTKPAYRGDGSRARPLGGLLHLGSSRHCKIGFAQDAQR